MQLEKKLAGGDLRSIGLVNTVIQEIHSQDDFDELFGYLSHPDRLIVMRAADAIEKLTVGRPVYLKSHQAQILDLCKTASNKELKWHLALLLPRLSLSSAQFGRAWHTLTDWAKDKANSRIVRVNAIQGLFELSGQNPKLSSDLNHTLLQVEQEQVPSINARVRLIRKLLEKRENEKGR